MPAMLLFSHITTNGYFWIIWLKLNLHHQSWAEKPGKNYK